MAKNFIFIGKVPGIIIVTAETKEDALEALKVILSTSPESWRLEAVEDLD